jgi:16S rRNA (guanine527-N7)-methyltransferase
VEYFESEPAAAEIIFGKNIDIARVFTQNLATYGEQRGLIGPREVVRLWTRHVLNCAVIAPLLNPGEVGDIGSGAGLPGIVLAIARPDVNFLLIEPMERRVTWLIEQVSELGLKNVTVRRGRSEDIKLTQPLDQVTARAVSGMKNLLPLTAPLLRNGGELILIKGSGVYAEIEAATKELKKYGVSQVEVVVLGEGIIRDPTRVFRGTVHKPSQ